MKSREPFSQISRRNFLKSSSYLLVSIPLIDGMGEIIAGAPLEERLPGSLRHTPQLQAWLKVLTDGRVRIYSGKVELGQGIRIALKQVAAEELYMDLKQVEVVLAETGRTPNEGYTSGSGSVRNSAMAVRYAAAYARKRLLQLASERLQVPEKELRIQKGEIWGPDGQKALNFFRGIGRKTIGRRN